MANSKLFEIVGGFEGRLSIEGLLHSKTIRLLAICQLTILKMHLSYIIYSGFGQ